MTTATIKNGHVSRKTLSSQIDRLDTVLDGLADNLNDAVALAVKEIVGQVVREAVEVAVKEVLAKPELLRAALAQHVPSPSASQPNPVKPKGWSLKGILKGCWNWCCRKTTEKVSQVKKGLGLAWSWCLAKLKKSWSWASKKVVGFASRAVAVFGALGIVGLSLWRFRKSGSIALVAGLLSGASGYFAGPVVAAMMCGVGGAALTLSALLLLPMWRMLAGEA